MGGHGTRHYGLGAWSAVDRLCALSVTGVACQRGGKLLTVFPHHKRRSDEAHAGTVAWGKEGSKKWLQLLNDHWIGPTNQYLCGNEITIADYFGACMVTIGDLVGCDLSAYPNVQRWLAAMKKLPSWPSVNEAFDGLREAVKEQQFVTL